MSMDSMKKYRLAVDENGSPFVLNSKGSIDFGYITEEMNLPPAPIRIAEGNDKYGLCIQKRKRKSTPALTTGHRSQPLTVKV